MAEPDTVFARFWREHTHGSLTVDVARNHVLDDAFDQSATESLEVKLDPSNPFRASGTAPSARFSSSGVRFKVMRHVTLGPTRLQTVHGREENLRAIDIAAGVSFELDDASFRPKARVRILRIVSLGLFPCAHVKVQRRIPIAKTGFSLRLSYFCPLLSLNRAFQSPARLILSVDDTDHYGIRLTQGGLEVAGNRLLDVWKGGVMMGSALITLPNTLDLSAADLRGEVTGPVGVKLARSGLKLKFP